MKQTIRNQTQQPNNSTQKDLTQNLDVKTLLEQFGHIATMKGTLILYQTREGLFNFQFQATNTADENTVKESLDLAEKNGLRVLTALSNPITIYHKDFIPLKA
jgi:hypothetical protein